MYNRYVCDQLIQFEIIRNNNVIVIVKSKKFQKLPCCSDPRIQRRIGKVFAIVITNEVTYLRISKLGKNKNENSFKHKEGAFIPVLYAIPNKPVTFAIALLAFVSSPVGCGKNVAPLKYSFAASTWIQNWMRAQ